MQVQIGDIVVFDQVGEFWNDEGEMDDFVGQPVEVLGLDSSDSFRGPEGWVFRMNEISRIIGGPTFDAISPRLTPGPPYTVRDIKVGDWVTVGLDAPRNFHMPDENRELIRVTGLLANGTVDNAPNSPLWEGNGWWRSYKDIQLLHGDTAEFRAAREERRLREIREKEEELERLTASLCLTMDKVATIAKDVFGEEFVMVKRRELIGLVFTVIVHLPEVKIENNMGESHIIRDLFVSYIVKNIVADPGYKFQLSFQCAKSTFSVKEAATDYYVHSHISGGPHFPHNEDDFKSGFCMSTSEYYQSISNLRMNPTPENWYLVFLGLKSFISWESLEGGPYRLIKDLSRGGGSQTSHSALVSELESFISEIPLGLWEYTPDGFSLNPFNPGVIDFFDKHSTIRTLYPKAVPVEQLMQGYTFKPFKFNDKIFEFKVIEDEPLPEDESTIEPEVVISFCNILKNKIKQFTKTYTYDLYKSSSKVFDKIEAFKQAQASHHSTVAEANR